MRMNIAKWTRTSLRTPGGAGRMGVVLAVFAVAGGLTQARALAATCKLAAPATVTVAVSSDQIHEAFDTTRAELKRAATSRGMQAHWPALGAYVAQIAYYADIKENAWAEVDGVYCAIASSVRLVLALKGRVIHLARELRQDRCLVAAVREHAWRHARADDDALKQIPALAEKLRTALAQLQPARAASEVAAKTLVTAAVYARTHELLNRLDSERARLNRIIDAPEAIAELRAQCQDEHAKSLGGEDLDLLLGASLHPAKGIPRAAVFYRSRRACLPVLGRPPA